MRQVVILTVGAVWQCDYERYAHAAVARKAGMSGDGDRRPGKGRPPPAGLSAKEQLAQRFTYEITTNRKIDDALYSEACSTFGPQGLVRYALPGGLLRYDLLAPQHFSRSRRRP